MKNDLATAILVAILGVVISYFACNTFFGEIPPYTFSTLSETITADLADPDPEVFNYSAINPTVEVYVGDCDGSDDYEACINENNQGQVSEDVVNEGKESNKSDKSNSDDSSNQRNQ